ncbi:Uncharacterised protein [Achromobacter sp. 2789STDY5608615]|nr:Uncharacterised protein [Achromobacter sp. 2789STDY5608615]
MGPNTNRGLAEFCQNRLPSTEVFRIVWLPISPPLTAMNPGRHGVGSGVSAPDIDTAWASAAKIEPLASIDSSPAADGASSST